ncbi:MAG: hypothetical protein COC04_06330 [Gammaproteobacteria bacterium]|nr:MAG: hypothetical protein COC04_06330 [Gammaproteobacteria bacterium]
MTKLVKIILTCALVSCSTASFAISDTAWLESYTLEISGEYQKAINVITEDLETPSLREFAHMRSAWLKYLLGKHSQSIGYYKKAIKINPKSIDARSGLILPLIAQGRWAEVERSAKQILKLAPSNYQARVYLMAVAEKKRSWEALRGLALVVVASYPSQVDAWVYLARSEHHLGNDLRASQAYNNVLIRYPSNLEAIAYFKNR